MDGFDGFDSAQPSQSSGTPGATSSPMDDMEALFGGAAASSEVPMATPSTESGLDAGFADLGLEGPVSSARDDELFSSTSYTEQLAGSPVPGGDESFGGSIHDGSVASESLSNDEAARGPSPGPALFTMGGGEKESRPHEDSASNAQNGFDFSDPAPSQAGQHFPDGLTSSEPTPLEKWRAEKQLELDALEREEAASLKFARGPQKSGSPTGSQSTWRHWSARSRQIELRLLPSNTVCTQRVGRHLVTRFLGALPGTWLRSSFAGKSCASVSSAHLSRQTIIAWNYPKTWPRPWVFWLSSPSSKKNKANNGHSRAG